MAGKKAEKLTGDDWEKMLADIPEGLVQDNSGGFAPYWTPELGKKFYAEVSNVDETDRNFIRFTLVNIGEEALECQRGPASGAETVMVQPNEEFTCSAYATLNLYHYMGCKIYVTVVENRKLPGNEYSEGKPRDLWEFKVFTTQEDKKMLDAERAEDAKKMRERARELRRSGLLRGGRRVHQLNNGEAQPRAAGDAE